MFRFPQHHSSEPAPSISCGGQVLLDSFRFSRVGSCTTSARSQLRPDNLLEPKQGWLRGSRDSVGRARRDDSDYRALSGQGASTKEHKLGITSICVFNQYQLITVQNDPPGRFPVSFLKRVNRPSAPTPTS